MNVPILDFESYYTINNSGINDKTVYSIRRKNFLKATPNQNGYLTVLLTVNHIQYRFSLHKLIAKHFIPNPNNYSVVHHKNHIRTDNRIENLEWVSEEKHKELHSKKPHKKPHSVSKLKKAIVGINKQTKEKISFSSVAEAANFLNGSVGNISMAARNKIPSAYGFTWHYLNSQICI